MSVRVQLSPIYENFAQRSIMGSELAAAAAREQISIGRLREALGYQTIRQNLTGYLKLILLNEVGQWSIAAQKFPWVARTLSAYAGANPGMTLGGRIPSTVMHPATSRVPLIVYPGFLFAGAVTFILALGFLVFVARPDLGMAPGGAYMLIATFFSAMCQSYTLFVSMVNLWTPRYLMAVFPSSKSSRSASSWRR